MFDYFDDVVSVLNQHALDAWEIYGEEKNTLRCGDDPVNVFIGQQEFSFGFAVRLWLGSHTAYAYTTTKTRKALQHSVQKAYDALKNGNEVRTEYPLSDIYIKEENRDFFDPHHREDSLHRIFANESFWVNEPEHLIFSVSKTVMHEDVQWLLMNSAGAKVQCRETLWRCSGQWRIGQSEKKLMLEDSAASHFFNSLKPAWQNTLQAIKKYYQENDSEKNIPQNIHLFLCPSAAADWLEMIYQNLFTGNDFTEYFDDSEPSDNYSLGFFTDDRTLPTAPGSATYDKSGFPTQKIRYRIANKTKANFSKPFQRRLGWTERNDFFLPCLSPGNFFIEAGTEQPENILTKLDNVIWIYRLMLTDTMVNSGALGFEGFYLDKGQSLGPCGGIAGPLPWIEWVERLQARCDDLIINRRIASPSLLFENIPVNLSP